MTTSAELNQARLTLQLQINQSTPKVRTLEFLVDDGANWYDILPTWLPVRNTLLSVSSSLGNLQQQNSGVADTDPNKVSLTQKLIENNMATCLNG